MASNAFKLPRSRRQKWESDHKTSQYSILFNKKRDLTKDGSHILHGEDHTDGDNAGNRILQSAGAPQSHIRHMDFKTGVAPSKDILPDKIPFSVIDMLFVVVSIFLYIVDIGLDCFVAYKHYLNVADKPLYFYFTLAFVVLSAVVTMIFSLWWYYFEYQVKTDTKQELPSRHWIIIRVVLSIMFLGPVMRYVDTVRYALKGRKNHLTSEQRQWYHDQMQYERVDGAMLRLFEAFIEAAPQTLLQVYIILEEGLQGEKEQNYFLMLVTLASIVISMVSLAWSIVAYHKALRMSRNDRRNISHFGLFLRFMWRFFEVNPRILVMAVFMTAYQYWLGVFFGLHCLIMLMWIQSLQTNFCEKPRFELFFALMMALIWSFCFFNVKDGHTRKRSLLYYTIYYVENVILTTLWLVHPNQAVTDLSTKSWYIPSLATISLGSIIPMLLFMLLYYKFKHPEPIPICLPASYWLCCRKDFKPDHRYNSVEGNNYERQGLTLASSPSFKFSTGSTPDTETTPAVKEPEETSFHDMRPPTLHQSASTQSLSNTSNWLESEDEPDGNVTGGFPLNSGDKVSSKPNLDSCVEVDGYLELHHKQRPPLHRQDTIPKYQAPAPPGSNYGATVPGGAPSVFTYNLPANEIANKSQGSTLPSNSIKAPAVLDSQSNFVPYKLDQSADDEMDDEDRCPSLPPRQPSSTPSNRDSQRRPIAEPRRSLLIGARRSSDESSFTTVGEDNPNETDLTEVTQLSEVDQSGDFLADTLSPSKLEEDSILDSSIVEAMQTTVTAADSKLNLTTDTHSSIDTPLKNTILTHGSCMSPDTPEKAMLNRNKPSSDSSPW